MALIITDECINCAACEPECPNNAIYEGDEEWCMADGTSAEGDFTLLNGEEVDADDMQETLSEDFYFIVADKCTECKGFHDEPQCAEVCPVDCCIIVPESEEDEEVLLERQEKLHS